MRAGVGGTFNVIHKGHELLFETAFTVADSVEVGLTSDEFAKSIKSVPVAPYFQRKAALAKFLARYGKPFDIVMISDMKGTASTSEMLDALVVSPETRAHADEINELRRRNGLRPLKIFSIKDVNADDTRRISSSRILKGEIDKDGRLLRPLKVSVGSTNKVKIDAVRNIFTQAFGLVEVVSVSPPADLDRQPREDKVPQGAIARAKKAIEEGRSDFGVGIEAGLFHNDMLDKYLDIQYCAIVDASGKITVGHGPGFEYPPQVIEAALQGRTVGDTMSGITGIDKIGHKMGSVGYLSDGMIDRTSLTELSVLMALIPRIRTELYSS
jgi:inosine/xanthosine triphosphatase